MKIKSAIKKLTSSQELTAFAFIAVALFFAPEVYAFTARNSDVGNYICWVANNFEGTAGRGIATIGISTIGVMALLGRITWSQAMIVGVGCSVLFGAPYIIMNLGSVSDCP